jgi:hypothetical protein
MLRDKRNKNRMMMTSRSSILDPQKLRRPQRVTWKPNSLLQLQSKSLNVIPPS